MQPEYLYCVKEDKQGIPDHKNYGYRLASNQVFADISYNQLLIDTLQKTDLEECIGRTSLKKQGILIMQSDYQSETMFGIEVNQMEQLQLYFQWLFY